MKLTTTTILLSLFVVAESYAQVGYWTWEKGPASVGQDGTYGTMGTASSNNNPGARSEGVTWTDSTNTLWLFSGFGQAGAQGFLNDLWKYDQTSGNWTWMKGNASTNSSGSYGTMGTASSSNVPHSRSKSISWLDDDGNFWVFGGASSAGYLNDLWKYEPNTNNWTWVSGTNTTYHGGIYGTQGTGSVSNVPGGRLNSSAWIDDDGNLWLFGGYGKAGSNTGMLNDLWKFNPTNNQWTWVSGSNGINQSANYGTQGVANASNRPGARNFCVAWNDSNGNFWLWGGNGKTASTTGLLNDLWKYDVSTSMWTWMKGSNATNQAATFGTQGTAASSNNPRSSHSSVGWVGNNGDLFLFGGRNDASGTDFLGTLWQYDISTNNWTWVKGPSSPNQYGTYGTMGAGNNNNVPGCRDAAITWKDGNGQMWLFGGIGYSNSSLGFMSDLWRFTNVCQIEATLDNQINPACNNYSTGVATATASGNEGNVSYAWSNGANSITASGLAAGTYSLTVTDAVGCTDTLEVEIVEPSEIITQKNVTDESCVGMNDGQVNVSNSGGTPNYTYAWSNTQTTASLSGLSPGTYMVTILDANNCSVLDTVEVSAGNPLPQPNLGEDTITTASSLSLYPGVYTSYLWQDGSTNGVFTATTTGVYHVTVTDNNGCLGADTINVTFDNTTGIESDYVKNGIEIFPNPTSGNIQILNTQAIASYAIYSLDGRLVDGGALQSNSLSLNLNSGTYILEVQDKHQHHSQLLIINRE